jgi:hypothetical protein
MARPRPRLHPAVGRGGRRRWWCGNWAARIREEESDTRRPRRRRRWEPPTELLWRRRPAVVDGLRRPPFGPKKTSRFSPAQLSSGCRCFIDVPQLVRAAWGGRNCTDHPARDEYLVGSRASSGSADAAHELAAAWEKSSRTRGSAGFFDSNSPRIHTPCQIPVPCQTAARRALFDRCHVIRSAASLAVSRVTGLSCATPTASCFARQSSTRPTVPDKPRHASAASTRPVHPEQREDASNGTSAQRSNEASRRQGRGRGPCPVARSRLGRGNSVFHGRLVRRRSQANNNLLSVVFRPRNSRPCVAPPDSLLVTGTIP